MESILCPERLNLDPQDPEAALAFELWLACFQLYLEEVSATEPAVMHRILLSQVTLKVYSLIRDLLTYEEALDALKRQYLRPVNTAYARHRLARRRQRPGESSAEFLRALQTLVRTCDLQNAYGGTACGAASMRRPLLQESGSLPLGPPYRLG
ncbi:uncharacterized protein LOC132404384 isoform X2 [Hypanus sabinus]|uniref:uncharacterized protein LOC132404384 isoform X2 n=1 Tax=Hypanus sabinus TaxID=79690 RepID=UPI0028C3E370|nr:uncharacterized protein LOC132404384 isoform X2 [Hypanus sabinus]